MKRCNKGHYLSDTRKTTAPALDLFSHYSLSNVTINQRKKNRLHYKAEQYLLWHNLPSVSSYSESYHQSHEKVIKEPDVLAISKAAQGLHKTCKGCRANNIKMSCGIAQEAGTIIPELLERKKENKTTAERKLWPRSAIRKRQKCKEWKRERKLLPGKKWNNGETVWRRKSEL